MLTRNRTLPLLFFAILVAPSIAFWQGMPMQLEKIGATYEWVERDAENDAAEYAQAKTLTLESKPASPVQINPNAQPSTPQNQPPLNQRHPKAGVVVAYSDHTAAQLNDPLYQGRMGYTNLYRVWTSPNGYNWSSIDDDLNEVINVAGKDIQITVGAGYCPQNDWPSWYSSRFAMSRVDGNQGCRIPQFWDPAYIDLYKEYIRALANHLARFDSSDATPTETDVLYVRAQAMAETMENFPRPSEFGDFEWTDFTPATNGRIYQVDLDSGQIANYHNSIATAYRDELERAYSAVGLPAPGVTVNKVADFWSAGPNISDFVAKGLWFEIFSGDPSPNGWYWQMEKECKTGAVRCAFESGNNWPVGRMAMYTYWEALMALNVGMEFGGFYGNNKANPEIQPLGAAGWIHNTEPMQRFNRYAGHTRNLALSPGVFVAFRGSGPERIFNNEIQHSLIWTDYEHGAYHKRPQETRMLYGQAWDLDSARRIVPLLQTNVRNPDWAAYQRSCIGTYGTDQCDYIAQHPDLYVGTDEQTGLYQWTYTPTDLGTMAWCDSEMFCQRSGDINLTEKMLWARQTDSSKGHDRIYVDIDSRFAGSLINGEACIVVAYLDRGTGQFSVEYDATGDNNKTLTTITKNGTDRWLKTTQCVTDAEFNDGMAGGNDISLYNRSDGDDIFHMVEVLRTGTMPVNTPTPFPTATPALGPTPASGVNRYAGRITTGEDDVREFVLDQDENASNDGIIDRDSAMISIAGDNNFEILHGLRYTDLPIPRNAIITNAALTFEASANRGTDTTWSIRAQKINSASVVTRERFNLSQRDVSGNLRLSTDQTVQWLDIPPWTNGESYTTPNLANILQELVNQPTWESGNAILFLIDGHGNRIAHSFNGNPSLSPMLTVAWNAPTGVATPTLPPTPEATPTPSAAGIIGNRVWLDVDNNGIQDSRPSGAANVEVQLWRDASGNGTADTIEETTFTNHVGVYEFGNLDTSGPYWVQVLVPTGYTIAPQYEGVYNLDSDPNPLTGFTAPITLAPGERNVTIDVGLVPKNGVQDSNIQGSKPASVNFLPFISR